MRIFKKYKSWSKISTNFFPLRILKFKKTKWKKIKKIFLKTKKNSVFIDHTTQVLQTKTWDRIKNYYKNKLRSNLTLKQRYDCNLMNYIHYHCNEKKYFLKNYIKNEYRIDVLLCNLNFFSSIYHARQHIKNNWDLINDRVNFSEHSVLMKGDVIQLLYIKKSLPSIIKKELKFSFLEVDYYTNTVIILKNINEINYQDILFNCNEKT